MMGALVMGALLLSALAVAAGCDDRRGARGEAGGEAGADAALVEGVCAFLVCDDGDPCTADACDPAVGCVHPPAPTVGCGPACAPIARPRGELTVPGRGIGRQIIAVPGYLYRPVGPWLEIYAAPRDGPVTLVGGAWLDGYANDVERVGDRLYTVGPDGLRVFDIVTPEAPRLIGGHPTTDSGAALRVIEPLAYVAERAAGLRIYDVSDPMAIVEIGALDTADMPRLIDVDPRRQLAVIGDRNTLTLIDVSDPRRPTERTQLGRGVPPLGSLRLVPGTALLHIDQRWSGAGLYDLSDLADPRWIALPARGALGPIRPEGAYVLDGSLAISLLDLSDPDAVTVRGEWGFGGYFTGFTVVDGDPPRAAMAGVGRFEVHPLADGGLGAPIAAFADGGDPLDVTLGDGRLFVADDRGGLRGVDVGDPDRPALIDITALEPGADSIERVAYDAGRLLVTGLNHQMWLFDVRPADDWPLIDRFELDWSPEAAALAGDRVWVVDYAAVRHLRLDDDTLRLEGMLDTERSVGGVVPLADPRLAAVAFYDGLAVARADGGAVQIIAELPWRADPQTLERVGDRVYAAGEYGGLLTVDLADPTAPRLIDTWVPDAPVIDLAAHPERVVAISGRALWLLPVMADGRFGPATRLPVRSRPERVAIAPDGHTVYLASREALVEIVELDCR